MKQIILYALLFSFMLLSIVMLSSCSKDEVTYERPYHYPYSGIPDTNRFHLPYTHPSVNGYVRTYYPYSNVLASVGNYQHGNPTGYWKFYYSSGRMMKEGNYSNGQLSGYWKFFYGNGCMKEEGNYSNNIRTGYWKSYHENCKLHSEGNYSNGNQQGPWKFYYEDGSMEMTVDYY